VETQSQAVDPLPCYTFRKYLYFNGRPHANLLRCQKKAKTDDGFSGFNQRMVSFSNRFNLRHHDAGPK
jgi:hypothetical protein